MRRCHHPRDRQVPARTWFVVDFNVAGIGTVTPGHDSDRGDVPNPLTICAALTAFVAASVAALGLDLDEVKRLAEEMAS